jgi:hypothetical protein
MIRIQSSGGLGNQLFIWNLAHYLENLYKCKIVIYFPKTGTDRNCEIRALDGFCKHRIEIRENDYFNYFLSFLDRLQGKSDLLYKLVRVVFCIYKTNLPSESFNSDLKKPKIVRGYFQSPELVNECLYMYFDELHEFTTDLLNASTFKNVINDDSTVFHIRRGDFLSNAEKVGLLTLEYFNQQIEPAVSPIIFTDADENDLEISEFFKSSLIFGAKSVDTWTTFALMTFAKKLVTSNSTFSWWAGILAANRGAEVVAPSPWTKTPIYGQSYLNYAGFIYKPSLFVGDGE